VNQFCTSCGAQNPEAAFCTSCGSSLSAEKISAASTTSLPSMPTSSVAQNTSPNTLTPKQKSSTKRKVLVGVLGIAVIAGVSAGGFFSGKASIDLKKERTVAYETGYQEGNMNGYSNGNEYGYDQGYKDGCYFVFSKVGMNLIAIASPFYESDVYGYYWNRSEVCK